MKKQIAKLTVPELTERNKARIIFWLEGVAKDLRETDAKTYAKPCSFVCMK